MNLMRHHGGMVIIVSFVLALLLTIIPLPESLRVARPDWVTITLIFWCLKLPERISITSGFMLGLLMDALTGTLLGQHALALSLIAYICVRLHQRIQVYPVWQQALTVLLLLSLHQLLVLWIDGIIGRPPKPLSYWLPSLVGLFLWPVMRQLLDNLRISFSVR